MRTYSSALSARMCQRGVARAHTGPHPAVMVIGPEKPGADAANACALFMFVISLKNENKCKL